MIAASSTLTNRYPIVTVGNTFHLPSRHSSSDTSNNLPFRCFSIMIDLPMKPFIVPEPETQMLRIEDDQQASTQLPETFSAVDYSFWLKAAESSFNFWDNESDAFFDTL